jgi:hypothetical protein
LTQQIHFGAAAERVAENILEDLFTGVLGWPLADICFQVGYADLILTTNGVKRLILEAKRPGALMWNQPAVAAALDQAYRYAAEQKVTTVGVSDGQLLYVADIVSGGLRDRAMVNLAQIDPPDGLWWLTPHGIYRDVIDPVAALPMTETPPVVIEPNPAGIQHPKYKLPARCFAYVGQADDPTTWRLPYLQADGSVDLRRLPKAIQAVLTNYRGLQVSAIPSTAIPAVLSRLADAANRTGRMPHQKPQTAPAYVQLAAALEQS